MRKLFVVSVLLAMLAVGLAVPTAQAQLPAPAQCATMGAGPGNGSSQANCDQNSTSSVGMTMNMESICFSNAPWVYQDTVWEIQTTIDACDERVVPGPLYFETRMLMDTNPANIVAKEYLVMNQRSYAYDLEGTGNPFRVMDVMDFWTNAQAMPTNPEMWRIVELSGFIQEGESLSYVYFDQWTPDCEADTDPYTPGTQSVRNSPCAYSATCAPATAVADVYSDILFRGKITQVKVYPPDGDMVYPGGTPYLDTAAAEDKVITFMFTNHITGRDQSGCPTVQLITFHCEQMNYRIGTIALGDEDRSGKVDYVDLGHVLGNYDGVAACWCPPGQWWPMQ